MRRVVQSRYKKTEDDESDGAMSEQEDQLFAKEFGDIDKIDFESPKIKSKITYKFS